MFSLDMAWKVSTVSPLWMRSEARRWAAQMRHSPAVATWLLATPCASSMCRERQSLWQAGET